MRERRKLRPDVKRDPEKAKEITYRWRARHPERHLNAQLKSRYDITSSQYKLLMLLQNGVCAGCLKPCSERKRLSVDHDHSTEEIRGLLCRRCNTVLGYADDDREVLLRLAAYLQNPTGRIKPEGQAQCYREGRYSTKKKPDAA